ncbi:MAG: thioredoxin family protein [Alphaproteobacteria bacterium]|nr:thioredoxin family protein [Alphaproteobacteria bacterium]
MALTYTPKLQEGIKLHNFALKSVDGKVYTQEDVAGENGTLVMFICNHCPYVKTIISRLVEDAWVLQSKGIGVVAIMSNDTLTHTEDSFENRKEFSRQNGFTFPYIIDETQEVAKKYGAVCTPDFFGYNAKCELQFRGRLDEVTPSKSATSDTKKELLEAMIQIAETGKGPEVQTPSMGCSIKWKIAGAT